MHFTRESEIEKGASPRLRKRGVLCKLHPQTWKATIFSHPRFKPSQVLEKRRGRILDGFWAGRALHEDFFKSLFCFTSSFSVFFFYLKWVFFVGLRCISPKICDIRQRWALNCDCVVVLASVMMDFVVLGQVMITAEIRT